MPVSVTLAMSAPTPVPTPRDHDEPTHMPMPSEGALPLPTNNDETLCENRSQVEEREHEPAANPTTEHQQAIPITPVTTTTHGSGGSWFSLFFNLPSILFRWILTRIGFSRSNYHITSNNSNVDGVEQAKAE
jgi:hypothetical protein